MKSSRVPVRQDEDPAAAVPPIRGDHEVGARVLRIWRGHPDDVPLGRWEPLDLPGGVEFWVTCVVPRLSRVVMTPNGRVAVLEATVCGFDYEG